MVCTCQKTVLILLSGLLLGLAPSKYQVPHGVTAQIENFTTLQKQHEEAVSTVARAVRRVFERKAWCESAKDCSSSTADDPSSPNRQCLIHACSGTFGNQFECNNNFPRDAKCPTAYDGTGNCISERNATLVNLKRPVTRLPPNALKPTGDKKEIEILKPYLDLRRDICALQSVQKDLIGAHSDNNLTHWLYVATTNNAFLSLPGKADCRGNKKSKNPILDCAPYQPTSRPWYVTAASGPRDIVFLLDRTSLTSDHGARLNAALIEALNGIDFRDYIAVVAFDETSTIVLGTEDGADEQLRNGETTFVKSLQEQIHDLTKPEAQYPNITMAFSKAFDLLEDGEKTERSSKCSKYIVLLTGNEDVCFQQCKDKKTCKCVENLQYAITSRQPIFEFDPKKPTTIVTLSESIDRAKQNNIERLAKTIVCYPAASGMWRRVTSSDDNLSAFSAFSAVVASSMFQQDPEVFSSQLYQDFSGLGEMFTLAMPVYDVDARRLVGVVGADLTLKKVTEAIGSENEAREKIRELSSQSRKCATTEQRSGCPLQALRSSIGSALCANFVPHGKISDYRCHQFGDVLYQIVEEELTYVDAVAKCKELDKNGVLAIADTKVKNGFLASLMEMDGSWIGMKVERGGSTTWENGEDVSVAQREFGFGETEVEQMRLLEDGNLDGACVTADRRGLIENWNVIDCTQQRHFVCQFGVSSRSNNEALCPRSETFVPGATDYEGSNPPPSDCAQSSISSKDSCSTEEDDAIKQVNAICNETGRDYSDFDRFACGGRADSSGPTRCSNTALAWWIILLIVVGAIIMLIAIVAFVVYYCAVWSGRRRQRDRDGVDSAEKSELPSDVPQASSVEPNRPSAISPEETEMGGTPSTAHSDLFSHPGSDPFSVPVA